MSTQRSVFALCWHIDDSNQTQKGEGVCGLNPDGTRMLLFEFNKENLSSIMGFNEIIQGKACDIAVYIYRYRDEERGGTITPWFEQFARNNPTYVDFDLHKEDWNAILCAKLRFNQVQATFDIAGAMYRIDRKRNNFEYLMDDDSSDEGWCVSCRRCNRGKSN